MAALSLENGGHVFSVEPDAENFSILEKNVGHNNCSALVTLVQAAASDRDGTGFLFKVDFNLGDHRLCKDSSHKNPTKVPMMCIDSLDAGWERRPDIVKIDAQGHEGHILTGAEKTFASGWRPVLFLEYWPCLHSTYHSSSILDKLAEWDYTLFAIAGWRATVEPMPFPKLKDMVSRLNPEDKTFWDLIEVQRNSPDLDLLR